LDETAVFACQFEGEEMRKGADGGEGVNISFVMA
jgi:hypothetical protein